MKDGPSDGNEIRPRHCFYYKQMFSGRGFNLGPNMCYTETTSE